MGIAYELQDWNRKNEKPMLVQGEGGYVHTQCGNCCDRKEDP